MQVDFIVNNSATIKRHKHINFILLFFIQTFVCFLLTLEQSKKS